MKTRVARREFLRRAGLTFGALSGGHALFEGILTRVLSQAWAQSAGSGTGTGAPAPAYVCFSFPGAPPRWMFDLLLTPFAQPNSSNFIAGLSTGTPTFGNLFSGSGSKAQPVYSVVPVTVGNQKLYLPPVWDMSLSKQTFTDILQNTLFVRGMDMEVNSHPLANEKQVAPIIGGYSLTGVVADESPLPIPAITDPNVPASSAFRSVRGLAATAINFTDNRVTNPAMALLGPFQDFLQGSQFAVPGTVPLQNQALAEFEQYSQDQGFTSSVLASMYDNAIQLMESNVFAKLTGQWSGLLLKYQNIITEAMDPSFTYPGFLDKDILATASSSFNFQELGAEDLSVAPGFNLKNMITGGTSGTRVPNMATNFAIAELILTGQICSSFCLGFGPLQKVQIGNGQFVDSTHDEHFTGPMPSIVQNTYFFRSFLGCLTEFVSVLKAANLFNSTILHICAEFSRTPRADFVGADHAYLGSGTTLISGMFPSPAVIGNILKDSGNPLYPGTWGMASNWLLDGFTRPIQTNDVAHQITTMLNASNIVTNAMTLLQNNKGSYTPRWPTGQTGPENV